MRDARGISPRHRLQLPQSLRSIPRRLLSPITTYRSLDVFNEHYPETSLSQDASHILDRNRDGSFSSANSSPSTAASGHPPLEHLSPISSYETRSDSSLSQKILENAQDGQSKIISYTIPTTTLSSVPRPVSSQQGSKYDDPMLSQVSNPAETLLSDTYEQPSTKISGHDLTSYPSTTWWYGAHIDAQPGQNPDWKTFLSPQWPALLISDSNTRNGGQYPPSSFLVDSNPTNMIQPGIPESAVWYKTCDTCNNPYVFYRTEGSWWVHVWMSHPEWTSCFPETCFPECGEPHQTKGSWLAHLWSVHLDWAPEWVPRRCMWEGCTSKCGPFKTSKQWLAHVSKKHQKSYWCNVSSCELRQGALGQKAFGCRNDLNRHRRQRHEPAILCTKLNCQARRNSKLTRADKRDIHDAKWHGPLQCTVVDCPRQRIGGIDHGFSTSTDLDRHLREKHHQRHK